MCPTCLLGLTAQPADALKSLFSLPIPLPIIGAAVGTKGPIPIPMVDCVEKVKPLKKGWARLVRFGKKLVDAPTIGMTRGRAVGFFHEARPATFSHVKTNVSAACKYRALAQAKYAPKPEVMAKYLADMDVMPWFSGLNGSFVPLQLINGEHLKELFEESEASGLLVNWDYLSHFGVSQDSVNDGPDWFSGFPPSKRRMYYRELLRYEGNVGTLSSEFDIFLKVEWQPLLPAGIHGVGVRPNVPRTIWASKAWTHLINGRKCRAATDTLHKVWNCRNSVVYAGGMTPSELKSWVNQRADPVTATFNGGKLAIMTDYSMFDQTHSPHTHDFARQVYNKMGWTFSELERLAFEAWESPVGKFRCGTKLVGGAMNASGRDDTALINALLNGSAMSQAIMCAFFRVDGTELTEAH